jgi:uncharacterized protein (TIGR03435 family)
LGRSIVGSSVFFLAACTGLTQTLSFEAASLKPAVNPNTSPNRIMRRLSGGPGTDTPGRFDFANATLKLMILKAYNLKEFQVEGPAWIDTAEFDLLASVPVGTTKQQAGEMLQTLLKERFKLEFHRQTKSLPQFALVVGKGGRKLKAVKIPTSPTGVPQTQNTPGIQMMMTPDGIELKGYMTLAQLADALTRQMARPVLDLTELTGTFDVDITWMPDTMTGTRMGLPPGGDGAEPSRKGGPGPSADPALTLAQALQDKLGLRLDARKAPTEVLIVDRAEKSPVEN